MLQIDIVSTTISKATNRFSKDQDESFHLKRYSSNVCTSSCESEKGEISHLDCKFADLPSESDNKALDAIMNAGMVEENRQVK